MSYYTSKLVLVLDISRDFEKLVELYWRNYDLYRRKLTPWE